MKNIYNNVSLQGSALPPTAPGQNPAKGTPDTLF